MIHESNLLPITDALLIALGLIMMLIALNAMFKIRDIRILYLCLAAVSTGALLLVTGAVRIILGDR